MNIEPGCNSEYPARRKYKCADTNNTDNSDGIKYQVLFKIDWKPDPPFYLPVLLAVTVATAMLCKNLLLEPLVRFLFTFLLLSNHFPVHFHVNTFFFNS
ncbi:Uncharacterised protein [Escherichia coli]|nr:Uncharacterised protein [Escherichia coli]